VPDRESAPASPGGTLVVAGTPIGDPTDASPRLRAELAGADIVAAEDTRRTKRLADDLGIRLTARVVSYYDAVERERLPELIAALESGARVVLVTDAGMPSVSDPGYRLVAAAVDAGLAVTAVPGPSAVLTALALSALPVDRFAFEGFPPRKAGERARAFAALAGDPRTLVFFEAPHRIAETLTAMAEAFGADRPAAVCRELTKTYEEVRRASLGELAGWAADGVRGEITVVVGGAPAGWLPVVTADGTDPRKAALAAVAAAYGLDRKDVYDAVVAAKKAAASRPSRTPESLPPPRP
jgi:16S rRNA (cytidine1402-2'-O)-methyltransferase